MNAGRHTRSGNRAERVARSMLGIALVLAVAWALTANGSAPELLGRFGF